MKHIREILKKKSDKGEKKRKREQQKYKNCNKRNSKEVYTYNEIITELSGQRRETY
jgi:hypothetical protein